MAINIKKLDEKTGVTRFLIRGVKPEFANAIRRAIMEELGTLAIEDVSIYDNDSVVFDEFLAHRLAMLPIKTDKTYKTGDKVKMVLEKEGPGMVYSKDIKSADPKVEVVSKKIPLTKLKKGHKLRLEMYAVMQTGKEHAKWQPAIVGYQELPGIEVARGCNLCEQCVKVCPKNVLAIKAKKVVLTDPLGCILCGACRDACPKEILDLAPEQNAFIFSVEPSGDQSAAAILQQGADVLKERFKMLGNELKKV